MCVCDVHHRQWDAIFRGGMVLETPDLSYIGPSEARRMFCVATIRRDARTGAIRVTVAGKLVLRNDSSRTWALFGTMVDAHCALDE